MVVVFRIIKLHNNSTKIINFITLCGLKFNFLKNDSVVYIFYYTLYFNKYSLFNYLTAHLIFMRPKVGTIVFKSN